MAGADQRPGRRRAVPEPRKGLLRRSGRRGSAAPEAGTRAAPAGPATGARDEPVDLVYPGTPRPGAGGGAASDDTAQLPAATEPAGRADGADRRLSPDRAERSGASATVPSPQPVRSAGGSRRLVRPEREPRLSRRGRTTEPAAATDALAPTAGTARAGRTAEPTSAPDATPPPSPTPTPRVTRVSSVIPVDPPEPASPAELVAPALPTPPTDDREVGGQRPRGPASWSTRLLASLWVLVTLAGLAGVVADWTSLDLPAFVPEAGAVTVTTALAFGLAVRTGGRPLVSGLLGLLLAGAAVVSGMPVLLSGAAVSTAVLGAVLGVMATTPGVRFPLVVRECLVGVGVAVVAAFAANGYGAQVSLERAGYLTLGLSLTGALALVYRLGAGFHGLGTRGAIMVLGGVGLLAVTLAYTEALTRWGPPGLVESIGHADDLLRSGIGAVPRPTVFLVGIPVLAWGVFSRARRRQGWWGAGFGAAGLAAIAASLLNPDLSLIEFGLGLLYNLVLGLSLGLLLIRADIFFSGARGRRARQAEEATAHRPEPGRLHPLL